ncbi:hypothetical protein TSAR_000687 [Trichomalopsis sarcophagae]|uniref:Ion transport domain-containing protein n=1 Tax=Trichomalopsis sarcophagae TaxID=543379 RepID=A0A232EK53_9HYME|nr:hypothetical protein TSAR_000687 [Trichomalopsis sarcophagae]
MDTRVKLFMAIERDNIEEALRILSENSDAGLISEGVGPLRITVLQIAIWKGQACLLDLLQQKGIDVNSTDKLGRCGLHYAAQQGNVNIVRWLLQHGALVNSKFVPSFCTKDNRLKERAFNERSFALGNCVESIPSQNRLGRLYLFTRVFDKNNPFSIRATTDAFHFRMYTRQRNWRAGCLPTVNCCIYNLYFCCVSRKLPLPDCWGRTPLHLSVKNNHLEVTKLLIEAGAESNVKDDQGIEPLLLAGSKVTVNDFQELTKYAKIVELLISAGAQVNAVHKNTGLTALHQACILGSTASVKALLNAGSEPVLRCYGTGSTPLHEAAARGHLQILRELMLKIPKECIDLPDKDGHTPLHRAAYQGHRDCVMLLIEQGGSLAAKTRMGISGLDMIFAYVPRPVCLLENALNHGIHCTSTSPLEKDSYIDVDFGVLTPANELQMSVICSLINAAANVEQLSLLQHPLLELFLRLKWNRLRIFFVFLVLVHVCFAMSVSAYSAVLLKKVGYRYLSQKVVLLSTGILLFHNTIQILMVPRYYVRQLETWLSLVCSTTALLVVLSSHENCSKEECRTPEWKLHLVSIVILLSWMHLMLLIGRFPACGYYALMFYTVLKNLLKVLLAFIWLIVGFALSFSVLFHEADQFQSSWKALAKTVVMMMGEYEYADMFAARTNAADSFLLVTGRVVFLAFVILASVVLMNLMIGLAVSDIQALEQVGHIQRLLKQTEFVAHLERVTDHRIFRSRWINKHLKGFIESKRRIPTKLIINITGNLANSNLGVPFELAENLIEIAKSNAKHGDETDGHANGERSKVDFKRAIDNIKLQLRVIEQFKLRDNNHSHVKYLAKLCLKRKSDFEAINI